MRRLANSVGTVEKLEQALFACLNEKEYCDISIAEISKRAGINRTTFYLLLGSKDELFIQLVNSVIDQWFQRFFDLNIVKNVGSEKELFHKLLAWIGPRRAALRRMVRVRTETFDGFSLFTEEFENRMVSQSIFRTDDKKKQMKYGLFIKVYSVGLTSILEWLVDTEEFDQHEFHIMIENLRYKGFYSVLED